ncbi:ATP-dependent metallopeptidase FtsH/Yme1/Tma family protein, partial [Streptomyces coelicoflavus]|uniref:ATP-dependent metallopeptidase FtsH/Yme1/Tma family protein n=1 Tax=Streptomyces coelicoflavus TaxID=285562 RepID=UPI003328FF73
MVWILLVIIGAIVLSSFFTSGPSYTKADTSVVLDQLRSGNAKKAVIQDKEQTLNLDLRNKIKVKGTDTNKIQGQFSSQSADDLQNELSTLKSEKKLDEYNVNVTQDNIFISLLINLLPIAVLVVLLLLFMSQMQGGGSRVLNF